MQLILEALNYTNDTRISLINTCNHKGALLNRGKYIEIELLSNNEWNRICSGWQKVRERDEEKRSDDGTVKQNSPLRTREVHWRRFNRVTFFAVSRFNFRRPSLSAADVFPLVYLWLFFRISWGFYEQLRPQWRLLIFVERVMDHQRFTPPPPPPPSHDTHPSSGALYDRGWSLDLHHFRSSNLDQAVSCFSLLFNPGHTTVHHGFVRHFFFFLVLSNGAFYLCGIRLAFFRMEGERNLLAEQLDLCQHSIKAVSCGLKRQIWNRQFFKCKSHLIEVSLP